MSQHWIKANAMSQSPNRMIYLQVMSKPGRIVDSKSWLCASTRTTRRFEESKRPAPPVVDSHLDRVLLWQYVSNFTRKRERTILVAYNLAEQIRLGQVLEIMPELGWQLRRFSLREDVSMVSWERDKAALIMIDAKSWLPQSLHEIARLSATLLDARPDQSDAVADQLAWAEQACLVLDRSIGALRDWIKENEMGNWRPTGAGMAWANWRHSHYTHKVLAGSDDERLAIEAASVGAGRAEAWRYGLQEDPPYFEWDLPLAYPRAALDAALPVSYFAESSSHKPDRHLIHSPDRRTLIEATVHQDVSILGVKHEGRWVWPTGTIHGWWWDDELATARNYGADIKIDHAYTYRAKPVLAAWAGWIIPFIEAPDSPATPIQRAAVKHWSRSLIGRFGLRYDDWQPVDVPVDPGIYSTYLVDDIEGITSRLMVVGKQTWRTTERRYGSDSVPSIMACIMSECRSRLWHLMNIAGTDHVIYVDTDSLICDQIGSDRLAAYVATGEGWGLRKKHTHSSLEILGVRQLITQDSRKIAGVPQSSLRTGQRQFVGNVTEGISKALLLNRSDVVHAPSRQFDLVDKDYRRKHLPGGYTAPYEL